MFRKKIQKSNSPGITLIETVIAVFIFTVGITSIVSTAIFAFQTHEQTLNRTVAMGLAREGVEIVRAQRDTNWMPPNIIDYCGSDDTNGDPSLPPGQFCHSNWLVGWFWINGTQTGPAGNCGSGLSLCSQINPVFNPNASASTKWQIEQTGSSQNGGNANLRKVGSAYTNNQTIGTPTNFYRIIRVSATNAIPPHTQVNPEIRVVSTVAWVGRGCPPFSGNNPINATPQCKVVVEDRLTNWKNY